MIVFVASRKYCVALLGFSSSLGSASTTSTSVRSTCSFSNRFAGLQEAPRPWIGSWLCGVSLMTGRNFFFPPLAMVTRSHEHIRLSSLLTEAGGGGEIRTHEAFRPSGFQDRRIQPLCHPSRQNEFARSVPLLTR